MNLKQVPRNKNFQAFEHASYNINNEGREGKKLPLKLFEALKRFAGDKELPYYSITAYGIRFKQYVGAIQIGNYCIEVLPKIDRILDENSTQGILIDMLRQIGYIKIKSPTESDLKIKSNYILESYLHMFLDETRHLIYKGLIKTYHNEEGNKNTLRGSLLFNKHISKNIVHSERFYVRNTTFDREHPLNKVLYKTLMLINQLSVSQEVLSETQMQLLYFPEMPDIVVSNDFFQRIKWDRKTEAYKKAIEIARLLLLNYHPDLSHGRNHVLALMFDMNDIWEKWFTKRLKVAANKIETPVDIRVQNKKIFWSGNNGERIRQKPDIIVENEIGVKYILDTKWKIVQNKPSEDDVRQMFAYNKLFGARQAFLVYPGNNPSVYGEFYDHEQNCTCGLKFISFIKEGRLSYTGIESLLTELLTG